MPGYEDTSFISGEVRDAGLGGLCQAHRGAGCQVMSGAGGRAG